MEITKEQIKILKETWWYEKLCLELQLTYCWAEIVEGLVDIFPFMKNFINPLRIKLNKKLIKLETGKEFPHKYLLGEIYE